LCFCLCQCPFCCCFSCDCDHLPSVVVALFPSSCLVCCICSGGLCEMCWSSFAVCALDFVGRRREGTVRLPWGPRGGTGVSQWGGATASGVPSRGSGRVSGRRAGGCHTRRAAVVARCCCCAALLCCAGFCEVLCSVLLHWLTRCARRSFKLPT
jgi:hypothetical protein